MSMLANAFSSLWLPRRVRKLLGFKQGGEEEKWAEKAVESLVKKIRKNKNSRALDDLENALANPGLPSRCVTIPRSLDGRLQVAHKKNLPHVIYCRVWRWPDLNNQHELKSIDSCKFSFNSKQPEVCINPYHYKRVECSVRYPDSDVCSLTSSLDQQQLSVANGLNMGQLSLNINGNPSPDLSMSPTRPFSCVSDDNPSPADEAIQNEWQQLEIPYVPPRPHRGSASHWCSVSYYELNSRVGELRGVYSNEFVINGFSDSSNRDDEICLGLFSNVNRNSTVVNTRVCIGEGLRVHCGTIPSPHGNHLVIKMKCLGKNAIFVQSRCFNISKNYDPVTVCKVPQGCELIVFHSKDFWMCIQSSKAAGYAALCEVNKMCSVRVSFGKGWGVEYPRRDITSTPCWTEITFFEPLKWLDTEMRKIDSPSNAISSKT